MDLRTGEALWHRDGEAPLPIRWALLRDPSGKRSPFALFCTDQSVVMLQLISWYVLRWNIEVTFKRLALISASAPNGSGVLLPLLEQPHVCQACLAWWSSWHTPCTPSTSPLGKRPGILKLNPLLSMPSLRFVAICGPSGIRQPTLHP